MYHLTLFITYQPWPEHSEKEQDDNFQKPENIASKYKKNPADLKTFSSLLPVYLPVWQTQLSFGLGVPFTKTNSTFSIFRLCVGVLLWPSAFSWFYEQGGNATVRFRLGDHTFKRNGSKYYAPPRHYSHPTRPFSKMGIVGERRIVAIWRGLFFVDWARERLNAWRADHQKVPDHSTLPKPQRE